MINGLLAAIRTKGDRGAIIPFYRIGDIKKDMLDLKNGNYHSSWLDRIANRITDPANQFIPSRLSFQPQIGRAHV